VTSHDDIWRPRLAPRARLRFDQIGAQEMLLFPEAALALNETGVAIVRLCDGRMTILQIVEQLMKDYPSIGRDALTNDVDEFLNRLYMRGLLI